MGALPLYRLGARTLSLNKRRERPAPCHRTRWRLGGRTRSELNWLRGPYIQFLGFIPEHQGHGLGTRVLEKLECDARAEGARNLWVAASAFNANALRFYLRHGFERAAVLDGLIQDGIEEVLLRKRLA